MTLPPILEVFQSSSGAYSVTIAQSIFANRMLHALGSSGSGIDIAKVLHTGVSELQHVFTGADLSYVLDAYMVGIKDVFAFSVAAAACTVLVALLVPFKRLPSHDTEVVKEKDPNTDGSE